MGKYDKLEESSATWSNKAEVAIANELAESNRLKRLELELKFLKNAYGRLYKQFKTSDNKTLTIPPQEKDKEDFKKEVEAIKKELEDKA